MYLCGRPRLPEEAAVDVDAGTDVEAVVVDAVALHSIVRRTQQAEIKSEAHLLHTAFLR